MAATLYVSDLDGTLLTNSAALSEFSRAELTRLLAEGVAFSVASARSVASMRSILHGLPLTLPVIEFNGAFISDLATGRHEIINAIDPEIARGLHALIARWGHEPLVSTFNGREDCVYYCERMNEGVRLYVSDRLLQGDPRLRRVEDLRGAFRDQVVCVTTIGTQDALADLALAVQESCGTRVEVHLFENMYSPGWYWLTVHDGRATKAQAVRTLMAAAGLIEGELVVFGDHINDVKLFRIATQAVAVANAQPQVIECATHVIGSNEEDSVVKYIRRHWGEPAAAEPPSTKEGERG